MPKRIYFDNAATTQPHKAVLNMMAKFSSSEFGNPSSLYTEGQKTRVAIDNARSKIAQFFRCSPQEIIFTSGATESNNLAIRGVVDSFNARNTKLPHIVTTKMEHHSVYETVLELMKAKKIAATLVFPNNNGFVDWNDVVKAIKKDTVLVSAIFSCNETGALFNVRSLGDAVLELNKNRKNKIIFHTDAVQAVKFYNCNVTKLNVDLLTFSAHKINGPKGIGGLYVKKGTPITSQLTGGKQEYGLRAGTQNTVGIIGMQKAFELLGSLEQREKMGEKIRKLIKLIRIAIEDNNKIVINSPDHEHCAPDIINFSLLGIDKEVAMAKLDLAGISCSSGSACVSGSMEDSHVIKSLGKLNDVKHAPIRFSLCEKNTIDEVNYAIKIIEKLLVNS